MLLNKFFENVNAVGLKLCTEMCFYGELCGEPGTSLLKTDVSISQHRIHSAGCGLEAELVVLRNV